MDISAWLRELGLERYEGAFQEGEIDPEILADLTDADLRELGIPLGPRKKLLKAIAALAAEAGPPPARQGKPPEPERRQLTVLFCDLVGSTELAARLDPEDMGQVIRAYHCACTGVVERWGGHVAKYMGDGVLTYFGWPQAHEDEAERAVRAGLDLVAAVAGLATQADASLAARVGIATGRVVVGELIGAGTAQEEAVVGETPNLAARLQGIAAPGQVVIPDATRRLLGAGFVLKGLGEPALKGISEPVRAFTVTGERAVESRFEARSGPSLLPIVGRDQELALLLERWALAKAGEGQGVLLVGEAGIGKSRISRAVLDAVMDEPHFCVRYQCSPYHTDSALWPVIQQLNHAAGLAAGDPLETRLDKLEELLDQAGGRDAAPLIADLLGLEGATRYCPLDLEPRVQRARTLAALVDQLLRLAARQPVLVVLEDAHWIDPTTLELIEQCLDRIAAARVLILLTSRPDCQPEVAAHPHMTRLTLNRLGRPGVEALIARLGGKNLPRDVVDTIIARTDGVPLFVEELTKAILEAGEISIPASLHDSLMARLDRVPEVKEIAQIAAVIGREFSHGLLAAVARRREPELQSALDRLAAAELIFRRGTPPAAIYSFKHFLVRDAAYQSLLKSRRRLIHGQIVENLEAEADQVELAILAHHATEAGLNDKAIAYWEATARSAHQRAAHAEAIASYESALSLLPIPHPEASAGKIRARLLIGLGAPLGAKDGTAQLDGLYREALELLNRDEEADLAAAALRGLWSALHTRGDMRGAVQAAQRLARAADRAGSPGAKLAACCILGASLSLMGEVVDADAVLRRTLDFRDEDRESVARMSGRDAVIYALSVEGPLLWVLGKPDSALSTAEAAMDRGVNSPRPYDRVVPHAFLLQVLLYRGDYELARQSGGLAVRVAEEQGIAHLLSDALVLTGWATARAASPDRGLELIRRGMDLRRAMGAKVGWSYLLSGYAETLHLAGETGAALEALEEAKTHASRSGQLVYLPEAHRLYGSIASSAGQAAVDAEEEFRRALEIAETQGARGYQLRAAISLAGLWRDRGKPTQARDLLAPVYESFTEGFDTADLKHAKALLDELA